MNNERERKFLIKEMPNNLTSIGAIEQGYLMVTPNRQLRVRITYPKNGKAICSMDFKHHVNKTDRLEFENKISFETAVELMNLCIGRIVKKVRYKGKYKGKEFYIDSYFDHNLIVCEIEYENEIGELPSFIGKEITGVRKYSNINLAK